MSELSEPQISGAQGGRLIGREPADVRLPFAFAKRYGVVVTHTDLGPDKVEVVCQQAPTLSVLAEIKRVARRELMLRQVTEEEFESEELEIREGVVSQANVSMISSAV